METQCIFNTVDWYPEADAKETAFLTFNAENWKNVTMERTTHSAVIIKDQNFITEIPKGLHCFNPIMTSLRIFKCGLTNVTKEDLKGLHNLKVIHLREMEIQELPSDLFSELPNLEIANFRDNDIKFIGKDTFKHLANLKFVDLSGNPSINLVYVDHRSEFFTVFDRFPVGNTTTRIFRREELNAMIDGIFHSKPQAKSALERLPRLVNYINSNRMLNDVKKALNINDNQMNDLQKTLKIDDFKDFVIKIDENEFKVHKLMLAARSTTLAEIIKNNPNADELILTDVDVETLKIILEYIYDDKMPQNYNESSIKVFAAAGKLKLEPLKQKMGKILLKSVDQENFLEMLKFTSQYSHEKLTRKSFEEAKKYLQDKSLGDEMFNNIDSVIKLVENKMNYELNMKMIKEELEKTSTS